MGVSRLYLVLTATVIVVAVILSWYYAVSVGCGSREDVTARVGAFSTALQQRAAQGKMSTERLADAVKRMNLAATEYQTTTDHAAYCEALDKLRVEFDLAE